ncbi:MAG TPA: adenylosuccinate lyase family protein [Solirubrobacteraceae bacterium]|nr:adenylosuccinate lyase family protein [Solirubrobacteraceae bacterium]
MTGVDVADSVVYGHLWSTPETRDLFDDRGRTRAWLQIIAALAAVQGELGIIPADAAEEIAGAGDLELDLDAVGEETRRSGHSMLGLIRVLQRRLRADGAEWVHHGATVQDVSDTWTALVMQRMLAIARRDLGTIERSLLALADEHRDTLMLGRTHGQPGLPITFGFKAAVWAAETGRHLERIAAAEPRLAVGQLAGAVGTQSSWGDQGPELQRRLMERLGLGAPDASWLTARDRVAEFTALLALVTGTLAKIGNEVYNLQRAEIGELSETPAPGVVGSITMPQKQNPERSEHLWTLARVVRASVGLALEGLVGEHERDGAAWKTEWAFLPRASTAAAAALAGAADLLAGLRVDRDRMRANLDAQQGHALAEPVMLALVPHTGRQRAHALVHRAASVGRRSNRPLLEALASDPEVTAHLPPDALADLMRPERSLGAVAAAIDDVLVRAQGRTAAP